MKLKALIVDDEYAARQELRILLSGIPDVDVVGEATNSIEAKELINALEYDIVFLDIRMPGPDGLSLAKDLQDRPNSPVVIFTTAFKEYALDAFDVNATSYLLKPINEDKLRWIINKVRLQRAGQGVGKKDVSATEYNGRQAALDRVPVERNGKILLLNLNEILYAYTREKYTFIHTAKEDLPTRYTLQELEERLKGKNFYRTHRQFLVNMDHVKEIVPYFKGTFTLIMSDMKKTEIPVSRAKANEIRQFFGMK